MTEELRFPEWQGPLQEAILEYDPNSLLEKVHAVEAAIVKRLQRLKEVSTPTSESQDERQAIKDALFILAKIKRDRLGFPDWK